MTGQPSGWGPDFVQGAGPPLPPTGAGAERCRSRRLLNQYRPTCCSSYLNEGHCCPVGLRRSGKNLGYLRLPLIIKIKQEIIRYCLLV